MRALLGFIVGIVATIAVAYFHDVNASGPGSQIVNWTQAGEFARNIVDTGRQQIERLIGK